MKKSDEQEVNRGGQYPRRYYGIYAFVRADFVHPPLPDISRSLKATKFDVSVLIEYEDNER